MVIGALPMKGPSERLKYDLRRLWECPVCQRRERAAGSETSKLCMCQMKHADGKPVVMKLIADHVQRVHPNGMTGRLHRRGAAGGLKDAELRLELRRVPAEGVERLAHTVGVVAAAGRLRQIFEARHCRQRRRGRLTGFLRCGHGCSRLSFCGRGRRPCKYDHSIGLIGPIA